ncbi:MAG: hypothetical protein ACHQM6_04870 [Candidatus Kapaibacterium sp.]
MKVTPQSEPPVSKAFGFFLVSLLIFIVIKGCFLFLNAKEFWGINHLQYLPKLLGIFIVIFSVLSILIGWRSALSKPSISKKKKNNLPVAKNHRNPDLPILLLVIATFLFLFWQFQIFWPYLGDGTVYSGFLLNFEVSGKMNLQWDAAPVLYILYGIYYVFLKFNPNQQNVFIPFAAVSLISGLLFIIFSFRFAKKFDSGKWWQILLFSLLLSAGGSLFFFGYMEVYPLQYAYVLIYSYFAFLYLRHKAKLSIVALMLILCIIFHLQNILLIPSFLFLFTLRKTDDREHSDKKKWVLRTILISVPLLLGIYALSQMNFLSTAPGDLESLFIPLKEYNPSVHITLFSGIHLLDIFNEHLILASVPLLVLGLCSVFFRKKIQWSDPFILFLLLNLFFFESLLFGGNFAFGLARDWDVCATLGITIALLAAFIFRQCITEQRESKALIIPISTIAICGIIAWIGVNINGASATSRYEDILSVYSPLLESRAARVGYENLRKYYVHIHDPNGEIRTERRMVELMPRPVESGSAIRSAIAFSKELSPAAKSDILEIVRFIGDIDSDSLLREEVFDKVRLGKPHTGQSVTLGDHFEDGVDLLAREFGLLTLAQELQMADTFISKHPALPYGYELRGSIMLYYTKDIQGSITYFQKSLQCDSMRTRSFLYLAVADARTDNPLEAKENFRRMIQLDPNFFPGLMFYASFLGTSPKNPSDIPDLVSIRDALKVTIETPPESNLEHSINEHKTEVERATGLLRKVEHRLNELRTP